MENLIYLPLLALLSACFPSAAQSQTATHYFLKIDGIPGESRDDNHPNEIDVLSLSLGVVQPQLQRFAGGMASAAKTASEGGIVESMSSSFTKLSLTYVPQNPNGSAAVPVTVSFDLKANKTFTTPQ